MCSSAKRLKLDNNKLKWNAVLADEFVTTTFSYVTFLKAQVIDNKMISFLVESLNQLHSLSHLKFKRIKRLLAAPSSPPTFELLISAKSDFKPLPANLNDMLTNMTEIELPMNNILTKEQFEIVSKQYWPVSFHLNKYIESLLDQSYFTKQVLDKLDFYSKLALHMAVFKQAKSAAIIVDQRTDLSRLQFSIFPNLFITKRFIWLVVASGIDCRSLNPLTHATVDALNNVAVRHINEINKITSNQNQAEIFKSHEHLNSFIVSEASQQFAPRASQELNKKLDPNDYLCKNYTWVFHNIHLNTLKNHFKFIISFNYA